MVGEVHHCVLSDQIAFNPASVMVQTQTECYVTPVKMQCLGQSWAILENPTFLVWILVLELFGKKGVPLPFNRSAWRVSYSLCPGVEHVWILFPGLEHLLPSMSSGGTCLASITRVRTVLDYSPWMTSCFPDTLLRVGPLWSKDRTVFFPSP